MKDFGFFYRKFWRLYFCMVKYLSFHNSVFAFKIGFNVNGQGHNVTDTPLVKFSMKICSIFNNFLHCRPQNIMKPLLVQPSLIEGFLMVPRVVWATLVWEISIPMTKKTNKLHYLRIHIFGWKFTLMIQVCYFNSII